MHLVQILTWLTSNSGQRGGVHGGRELLRGLRERARVSLVSPSLQSSLRNLPGLTLGFGVVVAWVVVVLCLLWLFLFCFFGFGPGMN